MNRDDLYFFTVLGVTISIVSAIVLMYNITLPETGIVSLLLDWVIGLLETTGYFGIFFLMVLESALMPVPSEIVMPFAGFLVYYDGFSIYLVVVAGTVGNLVGSLIAYYIGIKYGREFIARYGKYILMSVEHVELAERLFNDYGEIIIFASRMMPVVRTVISLPAGVGRMDLKKFIIYTTIGSIPWNFALTYAGYLLGEEWFIIFEVFRKLDIVVVIALVIVLFWLIKKK